MKRTLFACYVLMAVSVGWLLIINQNLLEANKKLQEATKTLMDACQSGVTVKAAK